MDPRPSIRWWPAAIIGLLSLLVLAWISLAGDLTGQDRFLRSMLVVVVTLLLLVLWMTFFSRLRWMVRLGILAALLVLGFGAGKLLRIRGVSGNLVPILTWSWSDEAEMGLPGPASLGPSATGNVPSLTSPFDYPQFLGPNRNATVDGFRLASDWSTRPPREVWRRPIGAGWSAFAVAGDLAVTQEQRGPKEMVTAYDLRTGEIRWAHGDPVRYETTIAGVGPRATPAIEEGRVFTLGATGVLNALDLISGRLLWSRDVLEDHDAGSPEWGKSCSPLVVDDLVVVSAGGTAGRSLVAYDKKTGEPVWQGGNDSSGYASPLVATLAGVRQLLIFNQSSLVSHAPVTGEVLWEIPWPADQPNVAQPLPLPGDRVMASSGYGIGSKLLQVTREEDGALRTELIWESPRLKAKFTNVVYHEGYVYGLDDGTLVCLDPETGERCWKRGRYGHGQVILVQDLLLVQTEGGDVVLVEPNPESHVELGRFSPLAGKSWNSPALAGPYLLVRNDREAACYELPLMESEL